MHSRVRCVFLTHGQAKYVVQGEAAACHVEKQMRDIPETLQDNMGQKMRLTVNGLRGQNCRLAPTNNTAVPDHRVSQYARVPKSAFIYVQVARPMLNKFWRYAGKRIARAFLVLGLQLSPLPPPHMSL